MQLEELLHSSVAVQVRVIVSSCGLAPDVSTSLNVPWSPHHSCHRRTVAGVRRRQFDGAVGISSHSTVTCSPGQKRPRWSERLRIVHGQWSARAARGVVALVRRRPGPRDRQLLRTGARRQHVAERAMVTAPQLSPSRRRRSPSPSVRRGRRDLVAFDRHVFTRAEASTMVGAPANRPPSMVCTCSSRSCCTRPSPSRSA